MRAAVLLLLAGCQFEPGELPSAAIDDAARAVEDVAVSQQDAPPCADDDGDAVCNAVDDWPCGAKPSAPPAMVVMTGNGGATTVTLTQIDLDGEAQLAVATAQQMLALSLHYAITDTACSGNCIDQVEVGWTPGTRQGCVFDNAVSKTSGAAGDVVDFTIDAPAVIGVYDLRTNLGQDYSCYQNSRTNWWPPGPAAERTIARLCVH